MDKALFWLFVALLLLGFAALAELMALLTATS